MEPGTSHTVAKTLQTENNNENHVVGENPCTIEAVCETLNKCDSVTNLWSKLVDVARSLGVPGDRLVMISVSLTLGNKASSAVLHEILQEWQRKESTNAKLPILVSILEDTGLHECADVLRQRFSTDYNDILKENVPQAQGSHNQNETGPAVHETTYYIDDTFGGSRTELLPGDAYLFEDNATTRRIIKLKNIFLRIAPIVYFFLMCISFVIWVLIVFVSEKSESDGIENT